MNGLLINVVGGIPFSIFPFFFFFFFLVGSGSGSALGEWVEGQSGSTNVPPAFFVFI